MPAKKRIFIFALIIMSVASLTGWYSNWGMPEGTDYLNEIRKNMSLYGLVYREIAQKYVEPLDPNNLMEVGIDAMLSSIDPYTILIEKEENDQLQIMTTGRYGGLGMLIGVREGWPVVVDPPYENTPALKAGLREGDRIIEIDGETTQGKTVNEVASMLRGEIGTAVTIKISRQGEKEAIEFRLIRAEIVVNDVTYAGMVGDGIGYIKLTRFSKNAGREVKSAIRNLRDQGMQGLIFDLRNNPGGLLEAAVDVADAFLPKGKLIVSTRGRVEGTEQSYYSDSDPVLGDLPLIVLVNEASASASEIVSGAVQDLDRGVIIGQPSYGKGLVQSVIGLTRGTRLKLTTARYYLPSGRLIQKKRRQKALFGIDVRYHPPVAENKPAQKPDTSFTTAGGRRVFGGDGIYPDRLVPTDSLNRYEQALIRQSMIFNYAVIYANTHENLQKGFEASPEITENFRQFLQEKSFAYKPISELAFDKFKQALDWDHIATESQGMLTQIEAAIQEKKAQAFDENIEFIKRQLAMEITAKLWGTAAKIEVSMQEDKDFQEALKILKSPEEYSSLLTSDHEIRG